MHSTVSGLAAILLLTGTVAAKPSPADPVAQPRVPPRVSTTDGAPVDLAPRPGSEADRLARQLMAHEINEARAHGEKPLVLVGMARLNDEDELLFVQLQSTGECGSGGCSIVSFKYTGSQWVRVVDTIGGTVHIARTGHRGMPDLIVKDASRLIWNGTRYVEVG